MSKSQEEVIKAFDELKLLKLQIDAERASHNLKTPPKMVEMGDFVKLKTLSETLDKKIESFQNNIQFNDEQESTIYSYVKDNKEIQRYCEENIVRLQAKPAAVPTPDVTLSTKADPLKGEETKETTVPAKPTLDIKDLNAVLKHMKSLLDKAGAQVGTNLAGVVKNYREFLELRDKVGAHGNTVDYLRGIKGIEDGFKKLQTEKFNINEFTQLPSQAPLTSKQGESTPDAQAPPTALSANDLGVDEEIDNSLSVDLSTLSPFASLDDPETTLQVGAVPVEAKVDERALPASGIDKSGLKAQLKEIAVENKWGISFPGDTIKIEDKNQSISILTTKQGMKITGSAELGSNVLDKWCDKNKFDKLDVKVSMPTVGKDIDAKSPEGDAAWKAFSNYNEKGFYVKDFPIDNFKDKPNYQDMKQKYEGMKEIVAAKQIDSPKMSG